MTNPIPDGPRLIPHLITHDGAAAIAFYERAFGAVLTLRLDEPGGRLGHAEMAIDGSPFMLANEYPELDLLAPKSRGGAPSVSLTLYVSDVDAFTERAVAAGAQLARPVTDEFYGDRVAQLVDPFGHRWSIHSRIEAISNAEMQRRFAGLFEKG